jgi:hypothetical protein
VKGLAVCLCLAGWQAQADCVHLGSSGLAVPVEEDFQLITESGMYESYVLNLGSDAHNAKSVSLRPLDIFAFLGGEELENGLFLKLQSPEVAAKGKDEGLVVMRGLLMTPFPAPLVFEMTCSSQGTNPDTDWCVPLLKRMRTKADGCAMGNE